MHPTSRSPQQIQANSEAHMPESAVDYGIPVYVDDVFLPAGGVPIRGFHADVDGTVVIRSFRGFDFPFVVVGGNYYPYACKGIVETGTTLTGTELKALF